MIYILVEEMESGGDRNILVSQDRDTLDEVKQEYEGLFKYRVYTIQEWDV